MGIDIENELNKIRWEQWRAKQDKEMEKTYCYWGENIDRRLCETSSEDAHTDSLYMSASGDFRRNEVSVYCQYEVCKCPPSYAWGYLEGTLIISVDGHSRTHIIDGVCSDTKDEYFPGLEESNTYHASVEISSNWLCATPRDNFCQEFNRTIGCMLVVY